MRTKSRWIVQMLKGQQQQKRYRRVWLETTTHHLFMKCHNIFFFFIRIWIFSPPNQLQNLNFVSVFVRPSFPASFLFGERQWLVAN